MTIPHRCFWYLRHGETDWNARNLAQGRTDVPLNDTGIEQAHRAADALRGAGIDAILASPLQRARRTAEIVGAAIGVAVQVRDDLIESNYGDHEGRTMADWFGRWVAGTYAPPGGESFAELRRRAAGAVAGCLQTPGTVLIVAHGVLMRALRAELGLPVDVRTPNARPLRCDPPDGPGGAWTLAMPEVPMPGLATPDRA